MQKGNKIGIPESILRFMLIELFLHDIQKFRFCRAGLYFTGGHTAIPWDCFKGTDLRAPVCLANASLGSLTRACFESHVRLTPVGSKTVNLAHVQDVTTENYGSSMS